MFSMIFQQKLETFHIFFHLKITSFTAVKYCRILQGDVCVMDSKRSKGLYTWTDLLPCANFAYTQNLHTYANLSMCTHLLPYAKFARMQKLGKFAPASDQVQISICVYANFAYTQICSCVRKANFAYVSIYLIVLYKCTVWGIGMGNTAGYHPLLSRNKFGIK